MIGVHRRVADPLPAEAREAPQELERRIARLVRGRLQREHGYVAPETPEGGRLTEDELFHAYGLGLRRPR